MNSSLDVPYLEHNLSNTSIGPVYHPHPNPGIHSWHHNPQDMTMVSVSLLDNAPHPTFSWVHVHYPKER